MSSSLIPIDVIIQLNNEDSLKAVKNNLKKVLFILPGLEGNCDQFRELADALLTQNVYVYGLQFNYSCPIDSINSMAIFYLELIKAKLNDLNLSKFYLAGYSFGGMIAIELTNILLNTKSIILNELFLFESSHVFFKIGAHLNFKLFKHEILEKGNILNYPKVYFAVLTIYLVNLIGKVNNKFQLYEYLVETQLLNVHSDLDETIEKAIDYLKMNNLYEFSSASEELDMKSFLKLLLLKSAAGYSYQTELTSLKSRPIRFFKCKKFLYSKILKTAEYEQMKNAIKFNTENFNLNEITNELYTYEFENGNHWSLINENLDEIVEILRNVFSTYDNHSKL